MIGWILVTSGRGPEECTWVVYQTVNRILKEASGFNYKTSILEAMPGDKPKCFKSALLSIEGDEINGFLSRWEGTLQWIGQSMFRPNHKRKNWFIGLSIIKPSCQKKIDMTDLKIERMRASGPGGQHTNKTESAIRITHLPTGINAVAQEERSQQLNQKLAMARLHQKLNMEQERIGLEIQRERWEEHNSIERGNAVKTYVGMDFNLRQHSGVF